MEVADTTITALSATIAGLAENTSYDVQVRATSDEGTSGWSASGQRRDGRQRGAGVHLVGDVRRGGERHRGGHGGGVGQRRGGRRDGLRDHRRRGYGVLLDRGDVGGADVPDGAELRGRAGPGRRQHLRGDGAGDQRHGRPGEEGDPGDHGDGDGRQHRGAGRAGCAVGVVGVGDEPERDLAGAGQRPARRSRTTTTATGRPRRRARGWR